VRGVLDKKENYVLTPSLPRLKIEREGGSTSRKNMRVLPEARVQKGWKERKMGKKCPFRMAGGFCLEVSRKNKWKRGGSRR